MKIKHKIVEAQAGQRVDLILAGLCPKLSLRELRRNWGDLQVTLNVRPVAKGGFVNEGDWLEADLTPVLAAEETAMNNAPETDVGAIKVLQRKEGVVALYKPAGLHSARLPGGRGGLSLEELLPRLLPGPGESAGESFAPGVGQSCNGAQDPGFAKGFARGFARGHEESEPGPTCLPGIDFCQAAPELFNRLDCLTSGLVLATENQTALERCLRFEESGQIEKRYFALVHGFLPGEIVLRQALDTDSRCVTRVLKQDDPNPLRHTVARPLLHLASLSALQFAANSDEGCSARLEPDLASSSAFDAASVASRCQSSWGGQGYHMNQDGQDGQDGQTDQDRQGFENGQGDIALLSGGQNIPQEKRGFSLLEVVIYLGARHQIRAHLSFAGYPIVGDPVYGPTQFASAHNLDSQRLYLHHFGLAMPGFVALCQAPWGQRARDILAGFYPALQHAV